MSWETEFCLKLGVVGGGEKGNDIWRVGGVGELRWLGAVSLCVTPLHPGS